MTSTEPRIDPALAALADAVLLPPFPGTTPPPWILRALERGLAGVTLFGPNVVGDTAALSAALRSAAAVEPVIAIDEEGGDVTRVAYAEGSPYPGNAALGVVDDVARIQPAWAELPTKTRASYMKRAADALLDDIDETGFVNGQRIVAAVPSINPSLVEVDDRDLDVLALERDDCARRPACQTW